MSRAWVGGLLAVLATSAGALSQSPAPPVFSGGVEIVKVVVSVQDSKGRPVPDLRREDFLVSEAGRPQAIEVFVRAADDPDDTRLGIDLALLLDVSDSMADNVKLSRAAAVRFLDAVPRARSLLVVLFHHEVRGFRYRPGDREAALALFAETPAAGGTALHDAVGAALSHLEKAPGRQVVVLLSDGESHGGRMTSRQLMSRLHASQAIVYPIAFSDGFIRGSRRALGAASRLEWIADASGGRVFRPEDSQALPRIYDRILAELGAQYVLGFVSDDPRRDDRYRTLRVEVKQRGLRVRHRPGYVAARPPGRDPAP